MVVYFTLNSLLAVLVRHLERTRRKRKRKEITVRGAIDVEDNSIAVLIERIQIYFVCSYRYYSNSTTRRGYHPFLAVGTYISIFHFSSALL